MWDFSWLERRWPGAGYENIEKAVNELHERGYNAVRIDAYPHLITHDPTATWTIRPCWNQQSWGSPARNKIQIQPHFTHFLKLCQERDIKVGLSTWFQKTEEADLYQIVSPQKHAQIWKDTLDLMAEEDLLDTILYVDFCNEWPFNTWAPFYHPKRKENGKWCEEASMNWMRSAISALRQDYPDIPYTFSYVGKLNHKHEQVAEIQSAMDFLEPHIWMVHANQDDFYRRIDHVYDTFNTQGYDNISKYGQGLYEADRSYWLHLLETHIDHVVEDSKQLSLPLITTECWALVNYKDWPLLDWEWIKEICAHGVRHAAKQERWLALATSNFCGPQFVGMWRDIDWHLEMTSHIKASPLPQENHTPAEREVAYSNGHELKAD